jgi:hypothetical protein
MVSEPRLTDEQRKRRRELGLPDEPAVATQEFTDAQIKRRLELGLPDEPTATTQGFTDEQIQRRIELGLDEEQPLPVRPAAASLDISPLDPGGVPGGTGSGDTWRSNLRSVWDWFRPANIGDSPGVWASKKADIPFQLLGGGLVEGYRGSRYQDSDGGFNPLRLIPGSRFALDPSLRASNLQEANQRFTDETGREPTFFERREIEKSTDPVPTAVRLAAEIVPSLLLPSAGFGVAKLGTAGTKLLARGAAAGGTRGAALTAAGRASQAGAAALEPIALTERAGEALIKAPFKAAGAGIRGIRGLRTAPTQGVSRLGADELFTNDEFLRVLPREAGDEGDFAGLLDQFEISFADELGRRNVERISKIPFIGGGVRRVLGGGNPSAIATDFKDQLQVVRETLMMGGRRASDDALEHPFSIGTGESLFGRTDPLSGRVVAGKLAGKSLNEVAENPSQFPLSTLEREWFDRLRDVEESLLVMLKRAGIEVRELIPEEVERYAGRVLVGRLDNDGNLMELAFLSAKPGAKRIIDQIADAQAKGFVYLPYDQAVRLKAQSVVRRIVNKRMDDFLLAQPDDGFRVIRTGVGIATRTARDESVTKVKAIKAAIAAAKVAGSGGKLAPATRGALRRALPDLADQFDAALAISPSELNKALSRMSDELLRGVGLTRPAFRQALEQFRLAAGKGARLVDTPSVEGQTRSGKFLIDEVAETGEEALLRVESGGADAVALGPQRRFRTFLTETGEPIATITADRLPTGKSWEVSVRGLGFDGLPLPFTDTSARNALSRSEVFDIAETIMAKLDANELEFTRIGKSEGFRRISREQIDRFAGRAESRLGARDITPGELTGTLKILRKDARTTRRMLREIYSQTGKFRNAERSEAIDEFVRDATERLVNAQKGENFAKRKFMLEREFNLRNHFEREGPQVRIAGRPGLSGVKFGGPDAVAIRESIDQWDQLGAFVQLAAPIRKINAVGRMFEFAGDASPFMIQFYAMISNHPVALFKSGTAWSEAFVRMMASEGKAKAWQAARLRQPAIRELLDESGIQMVTSQSGSEITEATKGIFSPNFKALGIPIGRLTKPLRAAATAYEVAVNEAGINIAEGMRHMYRNADGTIDIARRDAVRDYVDHMRGLASPERLGVSANQRAVESTLLLAGRYRRAVAALELDMLNGGLRGQLARRAMMKMTAGTMFAYSGLTIARGVQNGDSWEKIQKDLRAGLNPTSPRFLLWRIAGNNLGPGSKFTSDARMLAKIATDPEGFVDTEEFTQNNGVKWVRGQLAPGLATGFDVLAGRDFINEPTRGPLNELDTYANIARTLSQPVTPVWLQTLALEGGSIKERAVRGGAEFFGLRSFPENAIDILAEQSWTIYDKSYDETEPFERDLMRDILKGDLLPLQEEQVARGRELDTFFSDLDRIETDRIAQLLEVAADPRMTSFEKVNEMRNINNVARGAREEAAVGQEFDPANLDDPDPNKRALAQRNALFDDPEVQSEAGRIDFDVFERKLRALAVSEGWTREQGEYILRNTNRRPIPQVLFQALSPAAKQDISRSHQARIRHMQSVGATQEIIDAYQRAFFAIQ